MCGKRERDIGPRVGSSMACSIDGLFEPQREAEDGQREENGRKRHCRLDSAERSVYIFVAMQQRPSRYDIVKISWYHRIKNAVNNGERGKRTESFEVDPNNDHILFLHRTCAVLRSYTKFVIVDLSVHIIKCIAHWFLVQRCSAAMVMQLQRRRSSSNVRPLP